MQHVTTWGPLINSNEVSLGNSTHIVIVQGWFLLGIYTSTYAQQGKQALIERCTYGLELLAVTRAYQRMRMNTSDQN